MEEKIKVIKMIHLALCLGLMMAYILIGDLNALTNFSFENINSANMFFIFIPFLAHVLSNFLFRTQLKSIDPKLTLEEKMPAYQTASIIRWAILEGAAFVLLLLNKDFMIFGVLMIIYLIMIRPSEDSIKATLCLS